MSDTAADFDSPLVIGISGHRDLHPDGVAQLRSAIDGFFADLKQRLPDTPLRILVGMAQGGDLLAARAAVDAGVRVDALLPMPLDRYLEDFDVASAEELQRLLREPLVHLSVLPVHSALEESAARDVSYRNLMETLIDRCNLLLALWNGGPARLPGGTADTVLRHLGAQSAIRDRPPGIEDFPGQMLDASGATFVYWIPTPRTGDKAGSQQQPAWLSGIGENQLALHAGMPGALEKQLEELNTYNREFVHLRARGALAPLDSLMPAIGAPAAGDDRAQLERIDLEYGKADALANYFQRHSDRLFRWFSITASMMALLFLVYAKLHGSTLLLTLYVSLLMVSVVVFWAVRNRRWFLKHLVYRALAETMRTRFFLAAARADRLVDASELIRLTGIYRFAGFSWIANLLRYTEPVKGDPQSAPADVHRTERVAQHWVRGQLAYFEKRVQRLEARMGRLERLKSALIAAVVLLALSILLFSQFMYVPVGDVTIKEVVTFLMGLLPVWLGIWELYQNKMATRELLWQYRNQTAHFARAERQLSRAASESQRRALAQLGKESLMETYLWTIHRYHREYEPPSIG